jgi:uncharacterized damage-inducible protein DinB
MKHILYLLFCLAPAMVFSQAADNVQEAAANHIQYVGGQIISLAEAFPAESCEWSPAEGVRSVSQVLAHVAAANYFLGSQLGFAIPEDVNFMTMEDELSGKENLINALNDSFAWASEAVKSVDADALTDEAQFPFPGEFNKQSAILIMLSHVSDHKGQLVAYARSNGITPPWSE